MPRTTPSTVGLLFALVLPALPLFACAPIAPGVSGDSRAAACGSCHETQYEQWAKSRHGASATSPVFTALLPRVTAAWGDEARARCVACHAPRHGGDDGIGCVACHSAVGNTAERDGRLVVDLGAPVSGPFDDARATPAHGSRSYGLLESPVLCGTCHEVTGPGLFAEPTLTEHRASPAARAGVACASCHMPELDPGPIATLTDIARRRVEHTFVGLDPPWGAPPALAARSAEDSRRLVASALTLNARPPSGGETLAVTLSAALAGHAIPTGATFLRRVWVDVEFVAPDGSPVTVAGAMGVIELGARATRAGVPVPLLTDADAVEKRALDPGETRTVHVARPGLPTARASVHLRARAINEEVLRALGLEDRAGEVPVLDVASVEVALP